MPRLFPLVPHHIDNSPITKKVDIKKFRSGLEQRIALPDTDLRTFELEWYGLNNDELKVLTDFFHDMGAQFTAFIFRHPDLKEDIYVRFSDDTIEPKTVKTGNRQIAVKIQEVPEAYNDSVTGDIIVDTGGVFTKAFFMVTFTGGVVTLYYDNIQLATAEEYQAIIITAYADTPIIVRDNSGQIVKTINDVVTKIVDNVGNTLCQINDEQIVIFNNSSYASVGDATIYQS